VAEKAEWNYPNDSEKTFWTASELRTPGVLTFQRAKPNYTGGFADPVQGRALANGEKSVAAEVRTHYIRFSPPGFFCA
jgi:hypothetical protein